MGAPCGGWVEAFGCRGRALLAIGGRASLVRRRCVSGCVLGRIGGDVLRMVEWWVSRPSAGASLLRHATSSSRTTGVGRAAACPANVWTCRCNVSGLCFTCVLRRPLAR